MKKKKIAEDSYNPFSKFHPLTGPIPDVFSLEFLHRAKLARSLIKKHKVSEYEIAANLISGLICGVGVGN